MPAAVGGGALRGETSKNFFLTIGPVATDLAEVVAEKDPFYGLFFFSREKVVHVRLNQR